MVHWRSTLPAMRLFHVSQRSDPKNAVWRADLSASHIKIGDALRHQGKLQEALTSYQEALALAKGLAQSDPTNNEWQRDVAVNLREVGSSA